jgi:hypothetical protein
MDAQPPANALPVRFRLRTLMLAMTLVCVAVGVAGRVSVVLIVVAGVFLGQCVFFVVVLRLAKRLGASVDADGELPERRQA